MPHLTSDDNELLIAESGGLPVILDAARTSSLELQAQSARALRNLSVNQANKEMLAKLDAVPTLQRLAGSSNERIAQQVIRSEASTPPAHALTPPPHFLVGSLPCFHFRVPPRCTQHARQLGHCATLAMRKHTIGWLLHSLFRAR